MPNGPPTVERRIYFYRWQALNDDDDGVPDFTPGLAAQLIDGLDFATGQRYMDLEEDNLFSVWVLGQGNRARLRLGTIRRTGLPQVEDGGTVSALDIGEEQGLVEQAHAVFFPDSIVGVEFNFYGPRISRLASYVRDKLDGQLSRVRFDLLLRQDVQEQLNNLRELRLVQLRMNVAGLTLAQEADQSLPGAFRAAAQVSGATVVELVLRHAKRSRQPLARRAFDWVQSLASQPELKEVADVFKVKGVREDTGELVTLDLLKDQLVSTKRVVRHNIRERAVDPDSMLGAIAEAYRELRPQLEAAVGVEP